MIKPYFVISVVCLGYVRIIVDAMTTKEIPIEWALYVFGGFAVYAVFIILTTYMRGSHTTKKENTLSNHILTEATTLLRDVCEKHEVDDSHGVGHALIVLEHAKKAVHNRSHPHWPEHRELAILLAALLHDADDHKYFTPDSHNASDILDVVLVGHKNADTVKEETLRMISYVSASSNGDNIPDCAVDNPEFLIPRYADRLESIGHIGIKRCYDYSIERGRPLFNDDTPRPCDYGEVKRVATPERYERYQQRKCSDTMMDHYFDKLLHVAMFNDRIVRNDYLVNESIRRYIPLVNFCVKFGKTGEIDEEWIKSL